MGKTIQLVEFKKGRIIWISFITSYMSYIGFYNELYSKLYTSYIQVISLCRQLAAIAVRGRWVAAARRRCLPPDRR